MKAAGVNFEDKPRQESYGTVAVWCDPWGNRWDMIGPDASAQFQSEVPDKAVLSDLALRRRNDNRAKIIDVGQSGARDHLIPDDSKKTVRVV